ncbi:MFS transporter [Kineosporia mesophila]|uniref:MFS transporter n=1 Tax=Kineosporia mesophila TaxID=566012 RepID=A0ABP6YXS1_9ACTN|nr:MFS transporter [Kineosporia mesophila]MCD5350975.1 MFS transporter [Kineosporia mesophila]
MYTTLREILPSGRAITDEERGAGRRRVSRIVVTLGVVSFFTDLSSEMVLAVLPMYLTLELGLTAMQYGLVDGVYTGITAVVRIAGGLLADVTRRPKRVALVGYGVSCVTKLLFLPAGGFAAVTGLVALDRSGKGLRTAPRDAMIANSAETQDLGRAFGVHRAMDTAGALGGPLIAFGVLAMLVHGYSFIFVLSFSLAAIGVAVLALFVPERRVLDVRSTGSSRARRTLIEAGSLAADRRYRRVLAAGGLLSLATVSDGFLYLSIERRVDLDPAAFPLLYLGTAVSYLVFAIPVGRIADRVGRRQVFVGGHVLAVAAYLVLLFAAPGPALLVAVLLLVGLYYAATDGVLAALTAGLVPADLRGTGIAGAQTATAVGALLSAALFGWLWGAFGEPSAVAGFAVGLVAAIGTATVLLRGVVAPGR